MAVSLVVLSIFVSLSLCDHQIFLSGEGVDSYECGTIENPCRTISYALANASDFTTLEFLSGTYQEDSPLSYSSLILTFNSVPNSAVTLFNISFSFSMSQINFNNIQFVNNLESFVFQYSNVAFTKCIFNSTNELISNGTYYISSVDTNIQFYNCSFFDLYNYWAIYQSSIGLLSVIGCTFVNCSAVNIDYSQCNIVSSQFINGSGLYAIAGTVTVSNSSFINNNFGIIAMNMAVYGSFFDSNKVAINSTTSFQSMLINNTVFQNSVEGAIVVNIAVLQPIVIVQNSTFIQNSNVYGGALNILRSSSWAEDSTVAIGNCQFISNTAEVGGAIFIDDTTFSGDCKFDIYIDNNSFFNNSADYGGALFSGTDCAIKGTANTFIENFADQGSAIFLANSSSLTSDRDVFTNNGNNLFSIKNMGNFRDPPQATLESITLDDTEKNISLSGFGTSCAIYGQNVNNNIGLLVYIVDSCLLGYYKQNDTSFQNNPCVSCLPRQYNFGSFSSKCLDCPLGDNCASSVGFLYEDPEYIISKGYYPSPNISNPVGLITCPNIDACVGFSCTSDCIASTNVDYQVNCSMECSQELCSEGYEGRMCTQCHCSLEDQKDCWFSHKSHVCNYCKELHTIDYVAVTIGVLALLIPLFVPNSVAIWVLITEIIAGVILLVLDYFSNWWFNNFLILLLVVRVLVNRNNVTSQDQNQDTKFVSVSGAYKILIFFVQTMFYLSSYFFPASHDNSKTILSNFNYSLKGVQCTFLWLRSSDGISRLFIYGMLGPVFLIATLLFLVALQHGFKALLKWRSKRTELRSINTEELDSLLFHNNIAPKNQLKMVCISTTLYVLYMVYYGLSYQIIDNLSCSGDQFTTKLYLTAYPWFSCTDPSYSRLHTLSVFFFIFYCVGIPTLFAILLWKHRFTRDSKETLNILGFFYSNYNPKYFYMETVWIIRNLLITIGFSVFADSVVIQATMVQGILLLSVIGYNYFQIFKSFAENALHSIGVVVILLSYNAAILMKLDLARVDTISDIILSMSFVYIVMVVLIVFGSILYRRL